MKAIRLFIVLNVLFGSLFLNSCGGSDENIEIPETNKDTEKYIQVPIGFTGEITNVIESPLMRAAGDARDYYAFQVYSKPEDSQFGNYTHYAYGFFDNKEDMVINLKVGYKYKFAVSMIVDGSEKVQKFSLCNAGWTSIGNTFFVSSDESVRYMYDGHLLLKVPYDSFDRPNVDRFFGITEDYIPTNGGTCTINMKRVAFGAKFVAKKFDDGNLEISIEGAPMMKMNINNGNEIQDVFSFNRLDGAYSFVGEYAEDIPVNIVWVKPDNVRVPVASQKVSFKRNKLTTIEFEVKENTTRNSINLDADEKMEDGETLQIGGDGTNTEVDPMI